MVALMMLCVHGPTKGPVEARDVSLAASYPGPARPASRNGPYYEGCGADYHAAYQVRLRDARADVRRVTRLGHPIGDGRFEPFSVHPGEFTHLDYTISACQRANYAVRLRVDYRTDQGKKGKVYVPDTGWMVFSAVKPRTAYARAVSAQARHRIIPWLAPSGCQT